MFINNTVITIMIMIMIMILSLVVVVVVVSSLLLLLLCAKGGANPARGIEAKRGRGPEAPPRPVQRVDLPADARPERVFVLVCCILFGNLLVEHVCSEFVLFDAASPTWGSQAPAESRRLTISAFGKNRDRYVALVGGTR